MDPTYPKSSFALSWLLPWHLIFCLFSILPALFWFQGIGELNLAQRDQLAVEQTWPKFVLLKLVPFLGRAKPAERVRDIFQGGQGGSWAVGGTGNNQDFGCQFQKFHRMALEAAIPRAKTQTILKVPLKCCNQVFHVPQPYTSGGCARTVWQQESLSAQVGFTDCTGCHQPSGTPEAGMILSLFHLEQ